MEKPIIFSLTRSVELTKEVCGKLGVEPGDCEVCHFADGELIVDLHQTVRGRRVYIIQSTCCPVTESLMEILVFVDALRRSSAREITVVIPYFGYARQDRQAKPRQPITSKLVADLLVTAGVDRVVTFDLHASQIQGFFNVPVDNLTAIEMIASHFYKKFKNNEDLVVVSPDHGGVVRARKVADHLHCGIAIFDKRRPRPNVAEIMDIIGDVKGKTAIIVDDMIDTGGTILAAANKLLEEGATAVYASCVHPVFSHNAIDKIDESCIKELVTTDTIPLTRESSKVKVLSVSDMIVEAIKSIENNTSIKACYTAYQD